MAADGLANRDIARALFVTVRTVEMHLTHAYQKLGIASRRELPAALRGEPTRLGSRSHSLVAAWWLLDVILQGVGAAPPAALLA
jgi:hypothetical protein